MVQRVLIVIIILHGFLISNVFAATSIQEGAWLKLAPPIKGLATNAKHKDEIVVHHLSYGVSQAGTWAEADSMSRRVTTLKELTIVKSLNLSSPRLAQACAMKTQFDAVELVVAGRSRAFPFLKVTLEKVIIMDVSVEIDPSSPPNETITLSYRRARWEVGTEKTGYASDMQRKR